MSVYLIQSGGNGDVTVMMSRLHLSVKTEGGGRERGKGGDSGLS